MSRVIKNLPASIHSRLEQIAQKQGRPFQELFFYYSIERFLHRLSKSSYADDFVLKGGLMFRGWGLPLRRPTRDIDVQGYTKNTIENLEHIVKAICTQEVEPDGMSFDPDSVRGERIMDDTDNQGVRVHFKSQLGNAWLGIHIDISFGNKITPSEIQVAYPTLLGMPPIHLRGYPVETAIAEKFQAMVVLETINDRMKDFYDIWLLSRQVEIRGATLVEAIQNTFHTRCTSIPTDIPIALSNEFAQARQADWARFIERSLLTGEVSESFSQIIQVLRTFLLPPTRAAKDGVSFVFCWNRDDLWEPSD